MSSPNYIYNVVGITGTGSTTDSLSLFVSGTSIFDAVQAQTARVYNVNVSNAIFIGNPDVTPSENTTAILGVSGFTGDDNLMKAVDFTGNTRFFVRPEGATVIKNGESSVVIEGRDTGSDVGQAVFQGDDSVVIGNLAGANSRQSEAIFIGLEAGQKAPTQDSLIFIGPRTGEDLVGGDNIIGMGLNAVRNNDGSNVVSLGVTSGRFNTGSNVAFLGNSAGSGNSGDRNIFMLINAGASNSGSDVVGLGSNALFDNSGDHVIGIGFAAGREASAFNSVYLGNSAGNFNSGGTSVFIGPNAGVYNGGSRVFATGSESASYNKSEDSFFTGYRSGRIASGNHLIGLGDQAVENVDGTNIIGFGDRAAQYNIGSNVIVVGSSLRSNPTAQTFTFAGSAVNLSTQSVNLPSHGLGSTGEFVIFEYVIGTTEIGITDGAILKFEIVDANNVTLYNQAGQRLDSFIANTGTDHNLSVLARYSNLTMIGHSMSTPVVENHVYIGGAGQTGVTFMDLPTYASDGAADSDSILPSGGFYKVTGDRTVYQKP